MRPPSQIRAKKYYQVQAVKLAEEMTKTHDRQHSHWFGDVVEEDTERHIDDVREPAVDRGEFLWSFPSQ